MPRIRHLMLFLAVIAIAPVAGTLLRIGLKAGDTVTTGDAMASILPNLAPLLDARARQEAEQRLGAAEAAEARTAALVVQAEATATQARVDAERSRTLVTQGAAPHSRQEHDDLALNTSQRALEVARFAHHVAEHEVELVRAALIADDAARKGVPTWQVSSPVSGRVLRVPQDSELRSLSARLCWGSAIRPTSRLWPTSSPPMRCAFIRAIPRGSRTGAVTSRCQGRCAWRSRAVSSNTLPLGSKGRLAPGSSAMTGPPRSYASDVRFCCWRQQQRK